MRVTDDRVKGRHGTRVRRQLGPDLHPVTILAINALTTDFNLNLLDEAVTDVRQPAETSRRVSGAEGTSGQLQINRGKHNLHVCLVHKIGVTVNHGRHALVKVGLAVEGDFNRLHGEVGMALVQHLPEGNLGVTRNVDILCTVRH